MCFFYCSVDHRDLHSFPTRRSSDLQAMARFQREAQASSSLNHPNICTIYDIGQEDNLGFIAMEYLDGVTLKDRKSTRLNSSHANISYAVFCLKKKKNKITQNTHANT